jgi:hypothetical protein
MAYVEGNGKELQELNLLVEDNDQLEIICDNMTSLRSFHCVLGCDLGCCGAIRRLKSLSALFLSSWSSDSLDDPLLKIIKGCSGLKTLSINAQVTEASLQCLPTYLPLLESLEVAMSSERNITDIVMSKFAQLPKLKSLSLQKCLVTDKGFQLPLQFCPTLNVLKVAFSPNLTSDSVLFSLETAIQRKTRLHVLLPLSVGKASDTKLLSKIPPNLRMEFSTCAEFF